MEPLTVGLILTCCTFGGALLGMLAGATLPKHHLSAESKDVIKVAMAMMATISALVVSLLISTAKTSFDQKDTELREQAARTVMLDRLFAQYGPESADARYLLRTITEEKLHAIWGDEKGAQQTADVDTKILRGHGSAIERLQNQIYDLSPKNEHQRALKARALEVSNQLAEGRWRLLEDLEGRIQWAFLAMLVFWLTVVFVSFGLFAPRNTSVLVALCLCALSIGGAIYMIVEMDEPYGGYIRISSAPVRAALEQLGH